MAVPILMPKQGQSVETCIITEWVKKVGDDVKVGDVLFSYETDKASFECEAEAEGVLLDTFYDDGDEVPVLVNVGAIGKSGESTDEFRGDVASEDTAEETSNTTTDEPAKETVEAPTANAPVASGSEEIIDGQIKISPRAKRLSEKLGVYYSSLQGTGPRGRIIERDIEAAAQSQPRVTSLAGKMAKEENLQPSFPGEGVGGRVTADQMGASNQVYGQDFEEKPLPNIRKIIAKAMHASLQNSAQLTHHMSADVRGLLAIRAKVKEAKANGSQDNITLNDMVCYSVIRALEKFPDANTHFLGESMRFFNKVHLGLAVDTPRGLMVPVIRNADDLSLKGLSKQLKGTAEQCRQGNIDPELLASTAGTFTVSNLGAYGVEMFTPVLNVPQVGILGVNTISPKPKDLGNGAYGFVPHIGLSLTYDHRALDGAPATLFLKEIKDQIENFDATLID